MTYIHTKYIYILYIYQSIFCHISVSTFEILSLTKTLHYKICSWRMGLFYIFVFLSQMHSFPYSCSSSSSFFFSTDLFFVSSFFLVICHLSSVLYVWQCYYMNVHAWLLSHLTPCQIRLAAVVNMIFVYNLHQLECLLLILEKIQISMF